MDTCTFKKFVSMFLLSSSLFTASFAAVNQVLASPPKYTLHSYSNSESGTLDIVITRPGEYKVFDSEYYKEVCGKLHNWIDNTIELVKIHFVSPNPKEINQPKVEYTKFLYLS